ncbi:MAG: N-acetylneuraminate synthase family protein [Deltaproteobacteria bacterium]|nr:N-acetylneuraminate synthase family protein [Deltaproteobacteria bacterium]
MKNDFPLKQEQTFIVAEAEINHNGNLNTAQKMVDAAKEAGADAIKFQYILADEIVEKGSPFHDLFKKVEFSFDEYKTLINYTRERNVECFFTVPSKNTLPHVLKLEPRFLKIGSTNITNLPLLKAVGKAQIPVILSTGMATLGEIEQGLQVLGDVPVCLLHCTVRYPAEMKELNLRAIDTMKRAFPDNLVGYSDHTVGETASVMAVTLGAKMIEKHFTLDCSQDGPDHAFSTDPSAFSKLIKAIRDVESALGDGIKRPAELEMPSISNVRRYLVAVKDIRKGEEITGSNVDCRRVSDPGGAIGAHLFDLLNGWESPRGYRAGEILFWDDFKVHR